MIAPETIAQHTQNIDHQQKVGELDDAYAPGFYSLVNVVAWGSQLELGADFVDQRKRFIIFFKFLL